MAYEVKVMARLTQDERNILINHGQFGFYLNAGANEKLSIESENNLQAKLEEISKKQLVASVLSKHQIQHAGWIYSPDLIYFHVNFYVYGSEVMDAVMEDLRFNGFGTDEGTSIHAVESTAYFCNSNAQQTEADSSSDDSGTALQKFINSVKSRMTVVQIYQSVKDRGDITFDYLCFLVTAAGIATLSLSTNNYAGIVASMLLSPLMNPILAICFGLILRQKTLIVSGLRCLSISVCIVLVIGFCFGIVCHFISYFEKNNYPTSLMTDRAQYIFVLSILLFAIVSAPNLSTALLSNNSSAQIGNAISLSLLPPLANAGYLCFLSLMATVTQQQKYDDRNNRTICSYKWITGDYKLIYVENMCRLNVDLAIGSCFSAFITISNIIVILVIGYGVFKFKRLAAHHLLKEDVRKFYEKDLQEAYTETTMKTLKAKDPKTAMLSEMIKDYARLNKKDVNKLSTFEKTQVLGDLKSLTKGVTEDSHYLNISQASGTKNAFDIHSRLNEIDKTQFDESNITIQRMSTLSPTERKQFLEFAGKLSKPEFASVMKPKSISLLFCLWDMFGCLINYAKVTDGARNNGKRTHSIVVSCLGAGGPAFSGETLI